MTARIIVEKLKFIEHEGGIDEMLKTYGGPIHVIEAIMPDQTEIQSAVDWMMLYVQTPVVQEAPTNTSIGYEYICDTLRPFATDSNTIQQAIDVIQTMHRVLA